MSKDDFVNQYNRHLVDPTFDVREILVDCLMFVT